MAIKRDPSAEGRRPFRDTLAIAEIKRTTNSTSYQKESDFVNNKLEDAFSAVDVIEVCHFWNRFG